MSADSTSARSGGSKEATNWDLTRRLLALAWRYRLGCVKVLGLQATLLTLGMLGLGLVGVGVDFIRFHAARPMADRVAGVASPAVSPAAAPVAGPHGYTPKPPRWPFGLQPPADWGPLAVLFAVGGAILLFAGTRAVLNMLYTTAATRLVQVQIVVDLRAQVYDKMQRLSFRFYDENASGSLINRVTSDVQSVRSFVDGVVIQSLILALSLAVCLVYMLNIHVALTLACLASTPLLYILTSRFSRTVRPAYLRNRELFDEQTRVLTENIQGVHVVKGFARHDEEIERFRAAARAVRDQKHRIFAQISTFQPLIGLITQANLVVMLAYGGYLVILHDRAPDAAAAAQAGISVGQLLVFTGLLQQFSAQVANIANIANSMEQSLTAAQRVFEVLDTPVDIRSPQNAVRLGRARGEVRFENVTVAYRPGEPVLRGVSFCAEPGQQIAVLGATGSGKTTLLSLIPRFYDPAEGRVLLDGHDLRAMDVDDLRRNIGVVFQESFLFSNTIAANIAFGHPEAGREQIEHAARVAAAHDFITALPDGYETILREGGANLSGGQRQRLAIARAILLDPVILLLDDPTAAIDPTTEEEILQAMDSAMAGRTVFVVAHRLSTLRRADRVIVLDRGRIVQCGTHEELMAAQGHYRRAARLQLTDAATMELLNRSAGAGA